ncbi:hypothetical protein LV36_03850 [Acinetobacter baumannii]|nr:hypothetical protein LV36_03850 [Acinetobacter baumannii]
MNTPSIIEIWEPIKDPRPTAQNTRVEEVFVGR